MILLNPNDHFGRVQLLELARIQRINNSLSIAQLIMDDSFYVPWISRFNALHLIMGQEGNENVNERTENVLVRNS